MLIEWVKGSQRKPFILGGYAGCVDKDTQFLSPTGWIDIDKWNGEDVLQYNMDTRCASFTIPDKYVVKDESTFNHFKTVTGIDQMLCDSHNIVYETSKGHLRKKAAWDVIKSQKENVGGFTGKFPTTFEIEGGKGIPYTDEELRLLVAVFADGHFPNKTSRCTINLKKGRKKQRITKLLNEAGIPFKEHDKTGTGIGYTTYTFASPLISKKYPLNWFGLATREQCNLIKEECLEWDGSKGRGNRSGSFSTTSKSCANFVQYCWHVSGYRAPIKKDIRDGRNTCYNVIGTLRSMPKIGMRHAGKNPEVLRVPSSDGKKYCFEVPTGCLVLRRNDHVFVTGNTGKTTLLGDVISTDLGLKPAHILYVAYTGKAAQVMRTKGMDAHTIHSSIYDYEIDEKFDMQQMLKDHLGNIKLIVVDEASMADIDIRKDMESFGIPIIYVGDKGQLDPVGGAKGTNIMSYPDINLDEIMRQEADSGIIIASQICRQGHKIPMGQLGKDFKKFPRTARNDMKLLNWADVVLCGLNKTRSAVNRQIRKHRGYEGDIPQEGERVVCLKNNRLAKVNNGLTGKVIHVDDDLENKNYFYMDFLADGETEEVSLKVAKESFNGSVPDRPRKDICYFDFGYCLSVHKSQGSEFPNVVLIEERMTSTNIKEHRRWLYTGITRASNKIAVIGREAQ